MYLLPIIFLTLGFGEALEAAQGGYTFSLKDTAGEVHSFANHKEDHALVVIFVSTRCPVSNAYNARMESLYQGFKEKNISFLGINSNHAESVEEIATHAKKQGLTFPILKDTGNEVADRYKASVTPEVYVFGNGRELIYHGRIDNSANEEKIKSKDLHSLLSAISAGNTPGFKETKAFGCSIKRKK
jgi:peroxiredoxin